ncbi:hypothetical protein CLV47_102248 [Antricoccus suffuscus]|uniref:N-acetyltransferase domain-containing protein n=1 Tax=Antricoccus suffuscus TaxID=1629062 RepID=A0A2T1A4N2_9ACTN|nr:hypothetical protein CLV47_102248 [Antricoccus suffuscus]
MSSPANRPSASPSVLGIGQARVLGAADSRAVRRVLAIDPVESVLVGSRMTDGGIDPRQLGGKLWGFGGMHLESICLSGANLIPIQAGRTAVRSYAELALQEGRRCSSIVGDSSAVHQLWDILEEHWGLARAIRWHQPLMSTAQPSLVTPDPGVRLATSADFAVLFPAAVAMFNEEIGISPMGADGGASYRRRVHELIEQQRCYLRIDDGRVSFKAELGAVAGGVTQIQGVWVDPALRGQGLGRRGTGAVVDHSLQRGASVVSLYVNDFNVAAQKAYTAIGFRTVGEFASVLF